MSLVETVADDLLDIVQDTTPQLKTVGAERAAFKASEISWSAKEILGHLLDSAVNNQQRFVRAQQATELMFPGYEQTFWVSSQRYNDSSW